MSDSVLVERDGAIVVLTLNRPDVLNALDLELSEGLRTALRAAEADSSIRCVVLRGAGRAFMAGGDVRGFHREIGHIDQVAGDLIDSFHEAVEVVVRMPKPVVASLRGAVAGAGLSLALAADLAVAADDAVFTLAYANIGISPDGGSTWSLPRTVGRRRAMELAMLADRFDAAKALELGIVNRVVPADRLDAETVALAQRLAAGPTRAYASTKMLISGSFDRTLPGQLDLERERFVDGTATRDFREGVSAFVEKRKPEFKGE